MFGLLGHVGYVKRLGLSKSRESVVDGGETLLYILFIIQSEEKSKCTLWT